MQLPFFGIVLEIYHDPRVTLYRNFWTTVATSRTTSYWHLHRIGGNRGVFFSLSALVFPNGLWETTLNTWRSLLIYLRTSSFLIFAVHVILRILCYSHILNATNLFMTLLFRVQPSKRSILRISSWGRDRSLYRWTLSQTLRMHDESAHAAFYFIINVGASDMSLHVLI